jgi:hypothetical protein
VDLGSAADLSDPHGGVLRLAKTTSTTFANLDRARDYTAGAVDRVRRELAVVGSKDVCLVAVQREVRHVGPP